jgi:hypothetical protein
MEAYRTYVTIKDPQQVVLENVPFRPGQRVEVLLIASKSDEMGRSPGIQALFKETQSLPQIRSLSEEDIAEEVAAYRKAQ